MPAEREMRPRDKYTVFDRKAKGYRKGIHSEFVVFSFCEKEGGMEMGNGGGLRLMCLQRCRSGRGLVNG